MLYGLYSRSLAVMITTLHPYQAIVYAGSIDLYLMNIINEKATTYDNMEEVFVYEQSQLNFY